MCGLSFCFNCWCLSPHACIDGRGVNGWSLYLRTPFLCVAHSPESDVRAIQSSPPACARRAFPSQPDAPVQTGRCIDCLHQPHLCALLAILCVLPPPAFPPLALAGGSEQHERRVCCCEMMCKCQQLCLVTESVYVVGTHSSQGY